MEGRRKAENRNRFFFRLLPSPRRRRSKVFVLWYNLNLSEKKSQKKTMIFDRLFKNDTVFIYWAPIICARKVRIAISSTTTDASIAESTGIPAAGVLSASKAKNQRKIGKFDRTEQTTNKKKLKHQPVIMNVLIIPVIIVTTVVPIVTNASGIAAIRRPITAVALSIVTVRWTITAVWRTIRRRSTGFNTARTASIARITVIISVSRTKIKLSSKTLVVKVF